MSSVVSVWQGRPFYYANGNTATRGSCRINHLVFFFSYPSWAEDSDICGVDIVLRFEQWIFSQYSGLIHWQIGAELLPKSAPQMDLRDLLEVRDVLLVFGCSCLIE